MNKKNKQQDKNNNVKKTKGSQDESAKSAPLIQNPFKNEK